jgi:acetolactate synthase-1/2/3 large subunit
MKAHVYKHLADTLALYGVKHVFGMRVYPEIDTSQLRPIVIHHETSAALMAYGYARISGRPGVMTLNRPGTMNVVMGLAEAWNSSVPVIVLMDGLPITSQGKNALYEQDQLGMVGPVSKWIGDVVDLSKAPEMLRQAFRMATTGRPGPVVLNLRGVGSIVSQDQYVEGEVLCEPDYAVYPARRIPPDADQIREAAQLLARAERPCIVAGGGVNLSQAWDALRELAETGTFPVATTISGKGAFPEHHPLAVGPTGGVVGGRLGRGRVATEIVKESDVVLLVGTRTNEMATSRWTVPDPRSTIIQIDVDPTEIGRNYQTELGIIADARLGLEALARQLREDSLPPRVDRTDVIRQRLDAWASDNAALESSTEVPVHPAHLVRSVREVVGANTIVVSDGSSPFMWATSHIRVEAGPTFITPRGTGAIGTGLPMAIGAKLAAPEKDVICFEGDGGLMCGILAELETAARYQVGIVVVVFNNGSYLLEREHMRPSPLAEEMDFSPGINFGNIARELKCEGLHVERPEEIDAVLRKALEVARDGKPAVVDVALAQELFPSGR